MQWLYFAIIGVILLFRIIRAANKANANRPRRPQSITQQSSPPSVQGMIQDALRGRLGGTPPPVPRRRQKPRNPEVEQAESGHFSEERLIDEYRRTHNKGQTIKHHTHDYFDEEKDAQKSRQLAARKAQHPLLKAMRKKGGMKQAILMGIILEKKH